MRTASYEVLVQHGGTEADKKWDKITEKITSSTTLADSLRKHGYTGTKVACGVGQCGACTVLVNGKSVNSCLCRLPSVADQKVHTIESAKSLPGFDDLASRFQKNNATQCGMVMSCLNGSEACAATADQCPNVDIEDFLDGNLCRCTGMRPIVAASRENEEERRKVATFDMIVNETAEELQKLKSRLPVARPPELLGAYLQPPTIVKEKWHKVYSRDDLQKRTYVQENASSDRKIRLLAGDTSWVLMNEKASEYIYLSFSEDITSTDKGITLHFGTTISDLLYWCKERRETPVAEMLYLHLKAVAGTQLRNKGTVIGNLIFTWYLAAAKKASTFVSDLWTILAALKAKLKGHYLVGGVWKKFTVTLNSRDSKPVFIRADDGKEFILSDNPPFLDSKTRAYVTGLTIPLKVSDARSYKLATRIPLGKADLAVAAVRFTDTSVLYSVGCEPGYLLSPTVEGIAESLTDERLKWAFMNIITKFNNGEKMTQWDKPTKEYLAGQEGFFSEGSNFSRPMAKKESMAQIQGNIRYTHDTDVAGCLHAAYVLSGSAYQKIDDEFFLRTLQAATKKDLIVITAKTLKAAKVKNEFNAGPSCTGAPTVYPGDQILAEGRTQYAGQPVALVLAHTRKTAVTWANFLTSKFNENLQVQQPAPPLSGLLFNIPEFTIDQMKDVTNQLPGRVMIVDQKKSHKSRGTPLSTVDVTGTTSLGPQYHFYMETQADLAIPQNGGLLIYASTQGTSGVQEKAATILDLEICQVDVIAPPLGGGFGGKEPQSKFTALAAAAAAWIVKRPVKLQLDRKTDMKMIGKRHPTDGGFRVTLDKEKKTITNVDLNLLFDAGCTYDCSVPVLELGVMLIDNAYNVPNFTINANLVLTDKASNTAMRGFGVPQAIFLTESMMETSARSLKIWPEALREKLLYSKNGDKSLCGQEVIGTRLVQVWNEGKALFDVKKERKDIIAFNKKNTSKKRGMCYMPLKYGISFTRQSSNQAGATISVMKDGTVTLRHCGIEMGQGLHTKMSQIVARVLKIPYNWIRVETFKGGDKPSASDTGASTGTDLNGKAVLAAAKVLAKTLDRLDLPPFNTIEEWKAPGGPMTKWKNAVQAVYERGEALTATAWEKWNTSDENPFFYFIYASALSVAEVDTLTGEVQVLKSKILYDAGFSQNVGVDIGQIEGGFMQGLGHLTTEELKYDTKTGDLLTSNADTYKLPGLYSIPKEFKVHLYKTPYVEDIPKAGEEKEVKKSTKTKYPGQSVFDKGGVFSAKSTGEPPLVLAHTVYFAIMEAIYGDTQPPKWIAPLTLKTVQQMLMAQK